MQILTFQHKSHAEQWTVNKFGGTMNDATDRCILDANCVHTGHKCAKPVCKVDDIWSCNAGKEILGTTGETHDFMRENGTTDNELIIVQNYTVERHRHILCQQSIGNLLCLIA